MASVTIDHNKIGQRIRADASGAPRIVKQAIFSSAQRGRAFIVGRSPVDRGILRNAWRVLRSSNGADLVNDQPYAGVMERGARPFRISKEGREALVGWVKRKILDGGMGFFSGNKANQRAAVTWATKKVQAENKQRNRSMGRGKNRQFGPKADTSFRRLKGQMRANVEALSKQAEMIAYKIASKFAKVGIQGRRFVMKNLDILVHLMELEMVRFLSKFFDRAQGT